jgi:hypothetical protein
VAAKPARRGLAKSRAAERRSKVPSSAPSSQLPALSSKPPTPNHWKAGRSKLAAPVSKTGSANAEVGALPTPSASSRSTAD